LDRSTTAQVEAALDAMRAPLDTPQFRAEWSRLGRRTGSHPLVLTLEEGERLRLTGPAPLIGWGVDEVARVALLSRALGVLERDQHIPLVRALYQRGTIRERQAVLRALVWLPEPARFVELAGEATRTHVLSVFEAIALGNPYPARFFVRPMFEQMVQKVVTLRLPTERVLGLAERALQEVARAAQPSRSAHPALSAWVGP
jgi:hypothetical protein